MSTSKRKSATKQIKTIPIDQIRYLNPSVRNRRNFQEIVQSIASVGLKLHRYSITSSARSRSE